MYNMQEPAITVDTVSLSFDGEEVLSNVSFRVSSGIIASLIGPNGSGKTVLLKVCMGMIRPSTGEVRVLGHKPAEMRHKIGYVPQRFSFDSLTPITVTEFLRFSAPRCPHDTIFKRLEDIGIGEVSDALLGTLSAGHLQRVLIVRALLHDPSVIFMDEPASGIDIGGERTFYELVEHVHREHNTTVLMVSHEIDVVYRYAEQVICLNKRMICEGAPEDTLTPEVIRTLYGEEMSLYRHG